MSRAAGGAAAATRTLLKSQPWWQAVGTYDGAASTTTGAFSVDGAAINWRVRWTCQQGHLEVLVPGKRVVSAACPGTGTAYASRSGRQQLAVTASGSWHLQVDQQIDVPLVEKPLPGMSAATEIAHGALYRIDQTGSGQVLIYRLPDGRFALRLEDFFVTANSDLDVQLTRLPRPRSTEQIKPAPRVHVGPLDITAGSLNMILPAGVDPATYRSVVIWCDRLASAYAGAALTQG
ncbi:MAG: DM13 domain-containing protein [Actinobacteria bacterium]|nr:DM13 domain-containing protein [Actinomycetota bacterium]